MSDTVCSGIITKLESGRFDNQYNVEILLADGSVYTGADGVQVYDKKKDGSTSAVWPIVQDSWVNKKPYVWLGNFKTSDTKAGPKTYCTITFGQPDNKFDASGLNAAPSVPEVASSAPSQADDDWGPPPSREPHASVPQSSSPPSRGAVDKDRLITATAVVKSLVEGRYLTSENLTNGVFEDLVADLLALIDRRASV